MGESRAAAAAGSRQTSPYVDAFSHDEVPRAPVEGVHERS